MSKLKFDQGRIKFGKYSLTQLALGEVIATGAIFVVTIVLAWNAYKDARMHIAWRNAISAYSSRNIAAASAAVENALSYRPEFAPPHSMRAKLLADADDFAGSRDECEKLIQIDPTNEEAQICLGVLLLKEYDKKRTDSLLKQAQSAFSAVGGNPDAQIGLGHFNLRRKDLTGAEKAFTEVEKGSSPPSLEGLVDLYVGLGYIASTRGEHNRAREYYERARLALPGFDMMVANIAYLWARKISDLPLTREKFEQESGMLRAYSEMMFGLFQVDQQRRDYFKPALVELNTAWSCLALRAGRGSDAMGPFLMARSLDNNKRVSLNYVATLTPMILRQENSIDDKRFLSTDIEGHINDANQQHRDLLPRERAILSQINAARFLYVDNPSWDTAKRHIEEARNHYDAMGSDDPDLKYILLRTHGIILYQKSQKASVNDDEKIKTMEEAKKVVEEALQIRNDEDLRNFLQSKLK
jgi:tetratricopeptide (TPR) repeat protein